MKKLALALLAAAIFTTRVNAQEVKVTKTYTYHPFSAHHNRIHTFDELEKYQDLHSGISEKTLRVYQAECLNRVAIKSGICERHGNMFTVHAPDGDYTVAVFTSDDMPGIMQRSRLYHVDGKFKTLGWRKTSEGKWAERQFERQVYVIDGEEEQFAGFDVGAYWGVPSLEGTIWCFESNTCYNPPTEPLHVIDIAPPVSSPIANDAGGMYIIVSSFENQQSYKTIRWTKDYMNNGAAYGLDYFVYTKYENDNPVRWDTVSVRWDRQRKIIAIGGPLAIVGGIYFFDWLCKEKGIGIHCPKHSAPPPPPPAPDPNGTGGNPGNVPGHKPGRPETHDVAIVHSTVRNNAILMNPFTVTSKAGEVKNPPKAYEPSVYVGATVSFPLNFKTFSMKPLVTVQ